MSKPKNRNRSPIKENPLRHPGQSIDEEIEHVYEEQALPYIFASFFVILLAVAEWNWFALDSRPHPAFLTILAAVTIAFSVYKLNKIRSQIKNLKLGRDGEKDVGQSLEVLRESGYRVFHDIIGDGFNIDHVIVSAGGIFTVETKTYCKPASGDAKIHYDGRSIHIDGIQPSRDILGQARAQRSWLTGTLEETTGKNYPVRAVVVFPGWYVDGGNKASHHEVWVMNPKMLPGFVENEPQKLEMEDLHLVAYHLSRFIRAVA